MVLGNFHCQGFLLIRIIKKGHTVLAVGASGDFWIFFLSLIICFVSSWLCDMA